VFYLRYARIHEDLPGGTGRSKRHELINTHTLGHRRILTPRFSVFLSQNGEQSTLRIEAS
jgi:hypothetical protein